MSTSKLIQRAVCRALLGTAAAATSLSALAQSETITEVVVTGSRIAQPNQVSTSPVQVVTSEDIKVGGKRDITDVLNDLPQINSNSLGQDLGNRTSGLSSAGGVATANLRGLGPNRTLVLVNGRRLGAGSPNTAIQSPAPDLDQIPSALVERVDVVTGGASAVYGSDAIAGVVNFITRQNFEGLEFDYQYGINWHENDNSYSQSRLREGGIDAPDKNVRDGRTVNMSILAGTNFGDDDRGNITAYFGYLKADPVKSGNRDFGACQQNATDDLANTVCAGSGNSNYFEPVSNPDPAGRAFSVVGNQFIEWGTTDSTPPALFNSQPYIYIGRDNERFNGGFQAHYELNDNVTPYAEFSFMNDRSYQEIAPSALFIDSNPLEPTSGGYLINCSNPLLSAQQRSIICTPAQITADTLSPGSDPDNSAVVRIGRRNVEGGGRSSTFEHTNFRAVGGAKGELGSAWNYDAYAQYYYTTFNFTNDNYLNFESIGDALQVTGSAANPVCISGAPCVPYNIFTEGAVTPDQIAPLYTAGTSRGNTTLRIVHGDITGDLGEYGVKLPTASDGVAFNVGFEHRREEVFFKPDAASESGLLSGAGGASVPIDNGQSVKEGFVEVRVPIVQEMPGIHELVFDTGYRYSDYSLAGGINTHKFELQYAPVQDLRFRGSFQRAIRAPSIIELFNPPLVGQIQFGPDPCAPTPTAPASATLEQCLRTGVTAAQYGNGTRAGGNTVPQGQAGQLTQLQAGNEDLSAETATTYSIGATFSPSFLPNFVGSLDYYKIDLENSVGVLPSNIIMTNCLQTGDPQYCSELVRSATGGLTGASVASGGYIVQRNLNIGAATVEGIDLQSSYQVDLSEALGALRFTLNGAYLISNTTTPFEGAHTYDCAGLFGPTCQTVNPRWRHNLRTSWQSPWNVDVHLTWRYLGKTKLDSNDSDPTLNLSAFDARNPFNAKISAHNYFDLAANYNVNDNIELRAGINNVADKDPPIVSSDITAGGSANTYEFYDLYGRQLFLSFTARL
jgi:iron complex outermembrane receptor protein